MASRRIEIVRGRTRTVGVPLINPDGTDYDLTGAEVYWWIGSGPRLAGQPEPNVYLKLALGDGITAIPGGVQLRLTREHADMLPVGHNYHEMAINKGNDLVQPMEGPLVVYGSMIDLFPNVLINSLVVGGPQLTTPTLVINP